MEALLRFSLRPIRNRSLCSIFPFSRGYSSAWSSFPSDLQFATCQPTEMSGDEPSQVHNLVDGQWSLSSTCQTVIDPMNGEGFMNVADTGLHELEPFVRTLQQCPKSGLHNPLKNAHRYLLYGDVSSKAARALATREVEEFFVRLIQRVSPKSTAQARAEVTVTQKFLENFSGDGVRFLGRSFSVPGNHNGQQSQGMRWPYGPVAIITPFNFPLEIPALQLLGALYMGNKAVLKSDSKVSIVMEQFLRLLHKCGLPLEDAALIHCSGEVMQQFLGQANPAMTLFTGSSRVAEKIAVQLHGRCKLEDAGYDWKILGPDVLNEEYVSWVCDEDAYACSGQKCSAQSILFMHSAWVSAGIVPRLAALAARRSLADLTVGPTLTVTTEQILSHIDSLLTIPGSFIAFGGSPLHDHSIPRIYGAMQPTAVFVPLKQILRDESTFLLVTTEIFGPFQILTEYSDCDLPLVLEALERMKAHLTAAVVSNHLPFLQRVLGNTVNGTTYAGIRARTTGAPQNHWFGPAGDPRAAGIGTPEAIQLVWSCHREVIYDTDTVPTSWSTPQPT